MRNEFSQLCLALTLAVAIQVAPSLASGGEATEQLRSTVNGFVAILSKTPVAELQASGLPEQARKLVIHRFDFSEMARLSLGSHWKALQRPQQDEFVKNFTHRLLESYGRTVRASGNERILFNGEMRKGSRITVETQIIGDSGEMMRVDYRLYEVQEEWKVIDVTVDHVSMVDNYRAQFNRIIAKSSIEELLRKMKLQDS